ncbi:hypothetical protein PVK06_047343 [Gossypium arboreum]|uniref:Uncharacterized protein n=1 Tax=Gossypium arboreum TaxID=29729 RepID=A0ABR0MD10_GOSAR|nr:hypothetical protein PVK06_047343 [Gossypium arboreum]
MDNNGPINEASVERMTRGTKILILKRKGTSKTKKGKAKADSKETTLHTETSLWQEKLVVEVEVVVEEEKVAENDKEKEEDFVEKVVTAPGSVDANIDNLEQIGARLVELAKVTSKEQCNSWAIVFYTGPLQVASPTQTTTDDAGVEPGTNEKSADRTKPREKKRKHSKDKK